MPGISGADEFGWGVASCPATGSVLRLVGAAFFGVFFFAAGFAGIGMFMPGIACCCAIRGAWTIASATALAATSKFDFTKISP